MRRFGTLLRPVVLLAIGVVALSCGDKVIDNPTVDSYGGELIVFSVQGFDHYPQGPYTDLVTFSVTRASYTLTFQTHNSGLCDMSGGVLQFGSNTMKLTPEVFLTSNCETKRIPHGEMTTVFHGDSLFIGPVTIGYVLTANNLTMYDTSTFEFRLKAK